MIRKRAEERSRLEELRSVGLFADCSEKELRTVDGLGARIRIPAGTQMMTEGANARECYVLLEGTVAVVSDGETVATIGPGCIVGELALLSGRTRNATVASVNPLSVILLHHGEFAQLMRIPSVEAKIRRLVSERTTAATIAPLRRLQSAGPKLATA